MEDIFLSPGSAAPAHSHLSRPSPLCSQERHHCSSWNTGATGVQPNFIVSSVCMHTSGHSSMACPGLSLHRGRWASWGPSSMHPLSPWYSLHLGHSQCSQAAVPSWGRCFDRLQGLLSVVSTAKLSICWHQQDFLCLTARLMMRKLNNPLGQFSLNRLSLGVREDSLTCGCRCISGLQMVVTREPSDLERCKECLKECEFG